MTTFALAAQEDNSCYQIGYRYGKCAIQVMLKETCDQKNDVVIPDRC